jgi:hypothetical protein
MRPWMRLALAAIVFGHAFIYIRIGAMLPGAVGGWRGRSWLLGGAVTGPPLAMLVMAMHVVAGALLLLSALAIGAAPSVPGGWWPALPAAGAALGIAAFAVFWDGRSGAFVEEGGIGAVVSGLLLLATLSFSTLFR